MSDRLEPVDESWTTALAFVAHPDDLEYGAAAAIARWTSQGKRISYWLATRGEAGIDSVAPASAGPLREAEQRASAAIVGVEQVDFLDYQDGVIEYSLRLRRDVARVVRRTRPEAVITVCFHDSVRPGVPNLADHIAVGRAVVDGVRDAANRWVFPELGDEGLEPWSARLLLVVGSPDAAHGVDVTDHFERGVRSLKAHAAYLQGLGQHPMADPEEFLESLARQSGVRMGCERAVELELIRF